MGLVKVVWPTSWVEVTHQFLSSAPDKTGRSPDNDTTRRWSARAGTHSPVSPRPWRTSHWPSKSFATSGSHAFTLEWWPAYSRLLRRFLASWSARSKRHFSEAKLPGQLKIGVSSKQDLKDLKNLKNGIKEPYTPNTEPSTYRTRDKGSDQQLRASAATWNPMGDPKWTPMGCLKCNHRPNSRPLSRWVGVGGKATS